MTRTLRARAASTSSRTMSSGSSSRRLPRSSIAVSQAGPMIASSDAFVVRAVDMVKWLHPVTVAVPIGVPDISTDEPKDLERRSCSCTSDRRKGTEALVVRTMQVLEGLVGIYAVS
jgi:hypothetical protein